MILFMLREERRGPTQRDGDVIREIGTDSSKTVTIGYLVDNGE